MQNLTALFQKAVGAMAILKKGNFLFLKDDNRPFLGKQLLFIKQQSDSRPIALFWKILA